MTIQSIDEPLRAGLPRSIAFLAAHGIDPSLLARAGRIASRAGVAAEIALLRGGLLDEDIAYRALARVLDLPFIADPVIHEAARYPEGVLTGIAPLQAQADRHRFAYAPPPERFGEAAAQAASVCGVAVTTPTALRKALIRARAPLVAGRAAHALEGVDPDLTARCGLGTGQAVMLLTAMAGAAGAGLMWPIAAWQALSLLLSGFFLATVAIRVAASVTRMPVTRHLPVRRPDGSLPLYTILMPVYREARVLERLVAAIDRLDYPKVKLDAKLLVEAGDTETLDELARIGRPFWLEVIEVPPGAPRTKPRALNVALPLARGEFLTIYDAEDVPDPGQLRLAVEIFARSPPDVACLQARLVIDNTADDLIARLFTLEYAALFDVVNPALATFDLPVPLGGTSNHIRTEVLRDLGGWDAWNVTEDADLGIRLAGAGYRVGDLPSATLEEAPPSLRAWIRQRRRWTKGFLQVAITHSRRPLRAWRALGPLRFVGAVALTTGIVGSSLAYPFFLILMIHDWWTGDVFAPGTFLDGVARSSALALLLFGSAAMIVPAMEGARRRRFWAVMPFALLMPAYYLLVSWAAWRALADLVIDPFRWLKTEHGLARTSRSGLLVRQPKHAREKEAPVSGEISLELEAKGASAGPWRPRPAASRR